MEKTNYLAIARLQEDNWWYSARRGLIDRILSQHGPFESGLDLGCGLGGNLSLLKRHCERWRGLEQDSDAVDYCRKQGYESVFQGDATQFDEDDDSFDLVICLDVLEHVDDCGALHEIRRVLRPGGLLVVTVPAHRHLWNENDVYSQHLRRYSRKGLLRQLEGFDQLDVTYWNLTTYLPMLGYALVRRVVPAKPRNNLDAVPGLMNRPLSWALALENRVRGWLPTPTGTSLVALARAPVGEEAGRGSR